MTKNSTKTTKNDTKRQKNKRAKTPRGKLFTKKYQPSPEAKSNGHLLKKIREKKAQEIMKAIDQELSGKKMISFIKSLLKKHPEKVLKLFIAEAKQKIDVTSGGQTLTKVVIEHVHGSKDSSN